MLSIISIQATSLAASVAQEAMVSLDDVEAASGMVPAAIELSQPAADDPVTQVSAPQQGQRNRLLLTGTLVGWMLAELAVLFGYLKIQHATRGFYSGRLQSLAAAVALAVLGFACLFYFAWMSN